MEQKDKNSEKSGDSSSLQMESLEKKFNLVMNQYESAYGNYTSYLEYLASLSPSNNMTEEQKKQMMALKSKTDASGSKIDTRNFVVLKNVTYFGESSLNDTQASNVEECTALCEADINCSGATFNTKNETCLLRKGKGMLEAGEEDDEAVVDMAVYFLSTLKKLNDELLKINDEMMKEMKNLTPQYNSTQSSYEGKSRDLLDIYYKLLEDKENINTGIKDLVTLDQSAQDTSLMVTSNYYNYSIFAFIAVVIIVISLFINVTASGSSNTSSSSSNGMVGGASTMNTYYDFIYIMLFLGLAFFLKRIEGIAIWAVFVLLYVYYNRKKVFKN